MRKKEEYVTSIRKQEEKLYRQYLRTIFIRIRNINPAKKFSDFVIVLEWLHRSVLQQQPAGTKPL
jgi:hypothetical protein